MTFQVLSKQLRRLRYAIHRSNQTLFLMARNVRLLGIFEVWVSPSFITK